MSNKAMSKSKKTLPISLQKVCEFDVQAAVTSLSFAKKVTSYSLL